MSRHETAELAHRLAGRAEAVCRFYLFNGRRQGHYWQVGDARNTPGRSMFVRLFDDTRGPAGKWRDYVARRNMLRPDAGWRFFEGSAAPRQHNVGTSGRVA